MKKTRTKKRDFPKRSSVVPFPFVPFPFVFLILACHLALGTWHFLFLGVTRAQIMRHERPQFINRSGFVSFSPAVSNGCRARVPGGFFCDRNRQRQFIAKFLQSWTSHDCRRQGWQTSQPILHG